MAAIAPHLSVRWAGFELLPLFGEIHTLIISCGINSSEYSGAAIESHYFDM